MKVTKRRLGAIIGCLAVIGVSWLIMLNIGYYDGYEEGYMAAELRYKQNESDFSRVMNNDPIEIKGMDVWAEINKYRASKGLKELRISNVLCNGIDIRFDEVENNWGHDGFQKFMDLQASEGRWPYSVNIAELMTGGNSAEDAVKNWLGSPSHYIEISSETRTEGCAYARGDKVLLFLR